MITHLRKEADIKKFSAEVLGGTRMGDFLAPNGYAALEKSEKGKESLDRDLGAEQLDDSVFLTEMSNLVETDGKATPVQIERLIELGAEKDRFADQAENEIKEYEEWQEFHLDDEEEPDEPDDDEDTIADYRAEAEFLRSVAERLR